jgi:hypothetical protein
VEANGSGDVHGQPSEETPQQVVEREFRTAQERVRQVAERLRAALAEDERRTKEGH